MECLLFLYEMFLYGIFLLIGRFDSSGGVGVL